MTVLTFQDHRSGMKEALKDATKNRQAALCERDALGVVEQREVMSSHRGVCDHSHKELADDDAKNRHAYSGHEPRHHSHLCVFLRSVRVTALKATVARRLT